MAENDKGKANQEKIPDEKDKDWDKSRESTGPTIKQGDKSDKPLEPENTKEYREADSKQRGVAKIQDAASGAQMIPEDAIKDPGVNPWKLREGNEELKKDLGFSAGKCIGNLATVARIKRVRETMRVSDEVKKELESIEKELTSSAQ